MEISETLIDDDRLGSLEKQTKDMDAQLRELIVELLDLKKVTLALYPLAMETSDQEPGPGIGGEGRSALPCGAVFAGDSTGIPLMGEIRQDAPAEPVMALIMQADGTMKMEPRYGEEKTFGMSR
jgi:hypothetical protein